MRIVYMGSAELACAPLEKLLGDDTVDLVAVVTQPDRPKGRRRRPAPCPVKAYAAEKGLATLTPEKVGAAESVEALRTLKPDLFVVVAYGQFIPTRVLDLAPLGAINLHPSLLPKYRGASPIQWAIASGETVTGVTILYVSQQLDAGDMIVQREVAIGTEDTTATLQPHLAEVGANLLVEAVDLVASGRAERLPQREAEATYVTKLEKSDGRIDWQQSAEALRNRIRGFYPWPGCFAEVPAGSGCMLKITAARTSPAAGTPGVVLSLEKEGPVVAAGEGSLLLLSVQPEGKKEMSGRAYLNGYSLSAGDQLG